MAKDFAVDDAMVAEFQKYVESRRVKIDQTAWTQDRAFIGAMVRFEIDAAVFGMGVARRRLLEVDPQAQHALGLFPQAEKLLTMAKTRTTRVPARGRVARARRLEVHSGRPQNVGGHESSCHTGRALLD